MLELACLDKEQLGVVLVLASVRRCLRDVKKETAFWPSEKGGTVATHCYEALQSVDKALKSLGPRNFEAIERVAEKVASDYATRKGLSEKGKEEARGVQNQNG